jgi:hypothetical protein
MSERNAEPADDESVDASAGFVTNNFYAPVNAERAVFGTLGALPRHTEKNQGGICDTEILRTADRYVDPPMFQAAVARLEQEHRHPVRAAGSGKRAGAIMLLPGGRRRAADRAGAGGAPRAGGPRVRRGARVRASGSAARGGPS